VTALYLKALEIQGFKSFPDKTVLNFGKDITAIVGPNGSGKSNISDAIRWVMGEQSSRSLRGSKMEDVIFGGTEQRGQVTFAQVTLVIDNTEHIFPLDETEVSVTRRYSRSGESEYYINKQAVRLKDINELLMDTGLGREGYSIIGQGRIDEILSVKSADRREIFEEAAGISKFRHRKEETESKLKKTEENLVRINDKIEELEQQVGPLQKQAETAKRYLILRDEMSHLEISVWLENLDNIRTNAIKLENDYAAAKLELEQARQAVQEAYAAEERFSEQTRENDLAQEEIRQANAVLEGQISDKQARVAVLRSDAQHNRSSQQQMQQELQEQDQRTESLQQQIRGYEQQLQQMDEEMQQLQQQLEGLLEQARRAADRMGDADARVEALRGQEALATAAAADAKAEYSAQQAAVFELEQRKSTLVTDIETARAQWEETRTRAKQSRRELEDAEDEAAAVRNIIQGHSLKLEGKRQRSEQAEQRRVQLTMEQNNLESRIHLLGEMEKEYEGFQKAVRTVMQATEKKALRGLHGPVANLIRTGKKYAVAIEIALGAGMQNIVVDREEDAKAAMQFLKQKDAGRATFLPMTAIRGDSLQEKKLEEEFGFVGLAHELVEYDPQYRNVVLNLLGRTVVVEDIDCGIAMARKYQNRFRIVTLDGQVLNRGGSMTGGSVSKSAGILSRANELAELKQRQGKLKEQLEAALKEAEEAKRDFNRAQYELEVAESQQRQAEDSVLKLQGEKNHYDLLLSAQEDNIASLQSEQESIDGRIATAKERMEQALQQQSKQEEAAAGYQQQMQAEQSGQSDMAQQRSALSEDIARNKEAVAALQAQKQTTQQALENQQQLCSDLLGDQQGRQRRMEEYGQIIAGLEEQAAAVEAEIAALQQQSQSAKQQLSRMAEAKLQIEAARTANNRRSQELNDHLRNLEGAAAKLDQKRATGAMEEKQILDKLWDSYELTYTTAQERRMELESLPKANRRIGELKREINSLGNVNIGAIEEFDRVNTRYTYLSTQRDDVVKSKEELLGIIENITREMTEIFARQFAVINESFQTTFVELFGGGKATLELEDPNDILNCGIEIKVQPPGKTLKTLTLLSGGEKAFVAIALYFAILKVHPTPFCVMDEIEAALDEANVVRFAKYMRTIAGKTQFIVITHRRGTMEEADVLYGVTMQERGISRILTLALSDMVKQMKIKE